MTDPHSVSQCSGQRCCHVMMSFPNVVPADWILAAGSLHVLRFPSTAKDMRVTLTALLPLPLTSVPTSELELVPLLLPITPEQLVTQAASPQS